MRQQTRTMKFIEIASSAIIDKLKNVLEQEVAVTDLEGNIVADSELKYYGKHIPSALEAIRGNQTIKVAPVHFEKGAEAWVTPLVYDNKVLGSLLIKNDQRINEGQITLARSLAELLIHQVMVLRLLPTTSQVLDKFFYDLFESQDKDREKLIEQSRFLDSHYYKIDLENNRVLVLVNLHGFWQRILGKNIVPQQEEFGTITKYKRVLEKVFLPFANKESDILVVYFSGDNFIVLITDQNSPEKTYEKLEKNIKNLPDILKNKLQEEAKIVLAPYYPGLEGLLRSYQEAKSTLSLGQKLYAEKTVYSTNDVLVPKIISMTPKTEQKRFVEYFLDGLLKKPLLLRTLVAYFSSDLNLKETARKLHIHKNTLYYRFNKIERLIGLDPRSFHNAVKISLALLMYQINEEIK